jgi:hypothetical protein
MDVPTGDIESHRQTVTHLQKYHDRVLTADEATPLSRFSNLPYLETTEWGFKCNWCNKTLQSFDQLEGHLVGKEHTRFCSKVDIPPYGSAGHLEFAASYVQQYGNNPYARLVHWPDCIVDEGQHWVCRMCKNLKFQTQKLVNDHLRDATHVKRNLELGRRAWDPLGETDIGSSQWPEYITQDDVHWKCSLCSKKFNSEQTLEKHLVHSKHINKVAIWRKGMGVEHTPSVNGLASCYLCMSHFDQSVEDHNRSLQHICATYCREVDGFA